MLVALLSRENILVQRHKENKFRTIVFGILVIIVLVVLLLLLLPHNRTSEIVNLGDGTFGARIAKTESDREQGLSGVASLTSNKALLKMRSQKTQRMSFLLLLRMLSTSSNFPPARSKTIRLVSVKKPVFITLPQE
jgi:hypothetical protein